MSELRPKLRLETTTAAELAPLEALFDDRYPERLRELATCLYLELKSQDPEAPPHQLALALTEAVSSQLGGANFYMHKGVSYRLSKRDRQIMAEYNGNNAHLLARKHNLTDMRVKQIVAAYEEASFLEKQSTLPGVPAPSPSRRARKS